MKKLSNTLIVMVLLAFLSSCGASGALVLNHNDNSTQVHLASNNYRVLEQVSGSSEVNYILLIGGINKRKLYNNAYAEMVEKAQLTQGSRALVNIVTEEHLGGVYPFYFKRTITVSAHVVEFVQ